MNVVFRVDASSEIGSGHVMRCLALAQALCERNATCTFICRELDGNLISLIGERGFKICILSNYEEGYIAQDGDVSHANWLGCDWQTDASETQIHLEKLNPDWLIVDHYAIDYRWEVELQDHYKKLMVIDDLADREHCCDLLLDQNMIDGMHSRYLNKVPKNCTSLIGPTYAMLQTEYAKGHDDYKTKSGNIDRILIYFSGTDVCNLTTTVLSVILQLKKDSLQIDVVLSDSYPQSKVVDELIKINRNVTRHSRVSSLKKLLSKSDLAIGGGGITNWERICVGVPSVVVTMAHNQEPIAKKLSEEKYIYLLGKQEDITPSLLAKKLKQLLNRGVDVEMSERCATLVDGLGVNRVSSRLLCGLSSRVATLLDEKILLDWANDSVTRSNSFSTKKITAKEHRNWLTKNLEDNKNCRIYIIENETGIPVGTVRFNRQNSDWEVHFSLDPEHRGKGLGKFLVMSGIDSIQQELERVTIVGRVKAENTPSIHIFKSLGFLKTTSLDTANSIVYRLGENHY